MISIIGRCSSSGYVALAWPASQEESGECQCWLEALCSWRYWSKIMATYATCLCLALPMATYAQMVVMWKAAQVVLIDFSLDCLYSTHIKHCWNSCCRVPSALFGSFCSLKWQVWFRCQGSWLYDNGCTLWMSTALPPNIFYYSHLLVKHHAAYCLAETKKPQSSMKIYE